MTESGPFPVASAGAFDEQTVIQLAPRVVARPRQEWASFLSLQDSSSGAIRRIRLGPIPVRIGRRAPCELLINDHEVSGLHCEVRLAGDDVLVTDLESTNGTFVDGARITGSVRLGNGASFQVGQQVIKFELRDPHEMAQSEEIDRDLERASQYVRSILPAPLINAAVRTEWYFEPSTKVGGDAFGYAMLDEHRFACYLIDVSGHGIGAAMHAVAVMNTLRQRVLPDTDFADPASVLTRLNAAFQMDAHGGMLFSIWYGVCDLRSRVLRYCSGGHHPAYLLPADATPPQALQTRCAVLGALPDVHFEAAEAALHPGDRLYLFSDGVFEIATPDDAPWGLDDFVRLLGKPRHGGPGEPEQLFNQVRQRARPGPLDDDFSLLVVNVL